MYQHKELKKKRNYELSVTVLRLICENICEWFLVNKLNIHFVDDETKSILSQRRAKNIRKLTIRYKEINTKQTLGCLLDDSVSGETLALKVIEKINGKLKFLSMKNKLLTPELCRML